MVCWATEVGGASGALRGREMRREFRRFAGNCNHVTKFATQYAQT